MNPFGLTLVYQCQWSAEDVLWAGNIQEHSATWRNFRAGEQPRGKPRGIKTKDIGKSARPKGRGIGPGEIK